MAEQKKKSRWPVLVVLGLVLAALVVFALLQRPILSEHNRIVDEYINREDHHGAVVELEALHEQAYGPAAWPVHRSLVDSYIAAAGDGSISLAESANYLEKLRELEPDALTEEHRRILQSQGR